jgi:TusE/DsrC/DsvC family sulfur relay protein
LKFYGVAASEKGGDDMLTIECNGRFLERDKEGFLLHEEDWNDEVAEILAAEEGVTDFGEEKKAIVRFMRDYYDNNRMFPILQAVCREVGQNRECVTDEFIDPMKAWKIAGLPKLDNIDFVTVDGKHYLMQQCC